MIFQKSVGTFQGSSSASRRQWRGCLFEEVRQATAKGEAVNALCQMTGISRAGYYRWRVPPPSFPAEMELRDALQQAALEFPAYGYRRITFERNRRAFTSNPKRALRLVPPQHPRSLRH